MPALVARNTHTTTTRSAGGRLLLLIVLVLLQQTWQTRQDGRTRSRNLDLDMLHLHLQLHLLQLILRVRSGRSVQLGVVWVSDSKWAGVKTLFSTLGPSCLFRAKEGECSWT